MSALPCVGGCGRSVAASQTICAQCVEPKRSPWTELEFAALLAFLGVGPDEDAGLGRKLLPDAPTHMGGGSVDIEL